MQADECVPERVQRGTKRKLVAMRRDILAERTQWHSRKPTHLTVEKGFLPADDLYTTTEVAVTSSLNGLSKNNRRCILKNLSKQSSPERYYVIEEDLLSCTETVGFFSKFHSVLQVLLLALYEPHRFCAKPVAMTATDRLSNQYDTIFEMTEDEFVAEYRTLTQLFEGNIPVVQNGLLFEDEDGVVALVKGEALLRRLHTFLENHISLICPTQRSLLTIKEHFRHVPDFKLHFDCLYLLTNAEVAALEAEGETVPSYAPSAFDILYDAWVCCYVELTKEYELLHLSSAAWDVHRQGEPLQLTKYSKDIKNFLEKEALCFQASRAAKYYNFNGCNFIIPEISVFYERFKRNCINA